MSVLLCMDGSAKRVGAATARQWIQRRRMRSRMHDHARSTWPVSCKSDVFQGGERRKTSAAHAHSPLCRLPGAQSLFWLSDVSRSQPSSRTTGNDARE